MPPPATLRLLPAVLFLLPAAPLASPAPGLRIATWNLEWLVSPATTLASRQACLQGIMRPPLPCEAALDAARSSADYARLRSYANRIDADVVAFQEVENVATAARVFDGYAFCLTGSRTTQNLGFAIRKGLRFHCGPDFADLALGEHGRRGATLVVDPGGPRELHLLGVHLKSGCADGDLNAGAAACRQLGSQLPAVGRWMAREAAAGHRHAVMGDFNRAWEAGDGTSLALLDDPGTGTRNFIDPGREAGFRSCFPGQTFTRYIDHLVVGQTGGLHPAAGSFFRIRYTPADVRHFRLSDHCPTGVVLQFTAPARGLPQAGP